jgi:hypothetical protein
MYVRSYVCTYVCIYVCVSVEHVKDYFPSILMQTGSVKLSNFQRIVWCAVPYAVRASVWIWWPALRTNAHWRLSAHYGVFMWLIIFCRTYLMPGRIFRSEFPIPKQGKKNRIDICPQTRRFQSSAQQRVDPRSPDLSPLRFYLLGLKPLSVFSCNWKWRDTSQSHFWRL